MLLYMHLLLECGAYMSVLLWLCSYTAFFVCVPQVYKAEETLAVFFVVNLTDRPLTNTTITLSGPSNLKLGTQITLIHTHIHSPQTAHNIHLHSTAAQQHHHHALGSLQLEAR